ncbi:phospholipase A2 inhibitor and Ly6/PLAUR domain-containing protein-like isoform 2-T2 [Anomaloglossus baeobatrachus]
MKNLVVLLCTISTLAISVFSYRCYSCSSTNSTECKASDTECLGHDCMTAFQHVNLDGKKYISMYKGCANETLCGALESLKVGNTTFEFLAHCCTGDLCNEEGYKLPPEDQTPNGVQCPSAFCTHSLKECQTNNIMNCTGSMVRCMDYRATVRNPGGQIFLKGV